MAISSHGMRRIDGGECAHDVMEEEAEFDYEESRRPPPPPVKIKTKCSECYGSGVVKAGDEVIDDCDWCHGTGEVYEYVD